MRTSIDENGFVSLRDSRVTIEAWAIRHEDFVPIPRVGLEGLWSDVLTSPTGE